MRLINLGSDEDTWRPPLVAWLTLTIVGLLVVWEKIASLPDLLGIAVLMAVAGGMMACWPVASFMVAHKSQQPVRRLLLAIFAVATLIWSIWAMAAIFSSGSSTGPIGMIFTLVWQGAGFIAVYLSGTVLDWIKARLEGRRSKR